MNVQLQINHEILPICEPRRWRALDTDLNITLIDTSLDDSSFQTDYLSSRYSDK